MKWRHDYVAWQLKRKVSKMWAPLLPTLKAFRAVREKRSEIARRRENDAVSLGPVPVCLTLHILTYVAGVVCSSRRDSSCGERSASAS